MKKLQTALTTVSTPDRRWWGYNAEFTTQLAQIYSISIWNLETNEIQSFNPVNPESRTVKQGVFPGGAQLEYTFITPPQSYEISEPAATSIIATQDGGKFVESHGNIFKDIRLNGTVGLRPNPPSKELIQGLEANTGISLNVPSILQPKDNRGLDPEERTGFDEIIHLRNMFRHYFDLKADPTMAAKTVMVWTYKKESETYIVEPINFTTSRDRSSPLSWRYNITFRTLGKMDDAFSFVPDKVSLFTAASTMWNTVVSVTEDITDALDAIADTIDLFANLPANIISTVIGVGTRVLVAAARLRNSWNSFGDTMERTTLLAAQRTIGDVRRLFDEKYVPALKSYDLTGAVSASAIPDTSTLQNGSKGKARNALIKLQEGFSKLSSLDPLWESSKQLLVSDYAKAYLNSRGQESDSGSPLALKNIKIPTSGTEVAVAGGDTIRGLARRYLGDNARWKELAILNNLKYPYVSTVAGANVLTPGDKLIIPRNGTVIDEATKGMVPNTTNPDSSSEAQSAIVQKYGRDLVLVDTGSGTDLADVKVSSRGDLETIEGVPNVEQAMMIKFSTEQGELATHPSFGAKYPVGTKITMVKLQEFAINTRATFLQDNRIAQVIDVQMMAEGDKLITSSRLQLKDSNEELPITFAVRG